MVFFGLWSNFSKCVVADTPMYGVSIVAGIGGSSGNVADDSVATSSKIGAPFDVWLNPAGEIFMADLAYAYIRKVSTDGIISKFVGTGSTTSSGNGGRAINAGIVPYGICGDTANIYMYFAESSPGTVRRLEVSSNIINAFAGSGTAYNDNGPATNAKLNKPVSCVVDTMGNVYITDSGNSSIRKVAISGTSGGIITTVAGVGLGGGIAADGAPATSSPMNGPYQIYIDSTATLFINIKTQYFVRKVDLASTKKAVYTVIGKFFFAFCVFILNIFVCVLIFETVEIFCIVSYCHIFLILHGYSGNGLNNNGNDGTDGNGGPATSAALNSGYALTGDTAGRLYVSSPNRVRAVDPVSKIITLIAGKVDVQYKIVLA